MRFLVLTRDQYNDQLERAGAMQASDAFRVGSSGVRVTFPGAAPAAVDTPITGAKPPASGFTVIEAPSKEDAIAWVRTWPALDGDVEIREAGCPGGVPAVHTPRPPADAKQFFLILKSNARFEAGEIPDAPHLASMVRRNEEGTRAGVLVAGEGLQPSSRGVRVRSSGGKTTVVDGPFAEAKELIAGFWLIQVATLEDAIAWVRTYPYPFRADAEVEIRERVPTD
jgi:hypothetical protein